MPVLTASSARLGAGSSRCPRFFGPEAPHQPNRSALTGNERQRADKRNLIKRSTKRRMAIAGPVVVGVDDFDCSDRLIAAAAREAELRGTALWLAHAYRPLRPGRQARHGRHRRRRRPGHRPEGPENRLQRRAAVRQTDLLDSAPYARSRAVIRSGVERSQDIFGDVVLGLPADIPPEQHQCRRDRAALRTTDMYPGLRKERHLGVEELWRRAWLPSRSCQASAVASSNHTTLPCAVRLEPQRRASRLTRNSPRPCSSRSAASSRIGR